MSAGKLIVLVVVVDPAVGAGSTKRSPNGLSSSIIGTSDSSGSLIVLTPWLAQLMLDAYHDPPCFGGGDEILIV